MALSCQDVISNRLLTRKHRSEQLIPTQKNQNGIAELSRPLAQLCKRGTVCYPAQETGDSPQDHKACAFVKVIGLQKHLAEVHSVQLRGTRNSAGQNTFRKYLKKRFQRTNYHLDVSIKPPTKEEFVAAIRDLQDGKALQIASDQSNSHHVPEINTHCLTLQQGAQKCDLL